MRARISGKRRGRRDHARRQMAAGRMPGQADRTGDHACGLGDGRANFANDTRDARLRTKRVGRHGDGEAMRQRAIGQMRPGRLVEAHPIAAMDIDDEAPRRAFGQEQIKTVARPVAIAEVQPGPVACGKRLAIGPGGFAPGVRPAIAARDVDAVGVSILPIRNFPKERTCLPPAGSSADNALCATAEARRPPSGAAFKRTCSTRRIANDIGCRLNRSCRLRIMCDSLCRLSAGGPNHGQRPDEEQQGSSQTEEGRQEAGCRRHLKAAPAAAKPKGK